MEETQMLKTPHVMKMRVRSQELVRYGAILLAGSFGGVLSGAPLPLVNGDFETGSDGDSSHEPISGWVDSGGRAGFWLQDGSGGGSFPQDPSEPQAGSLYLSANRLAGGAGSQASSSALTQTVAVPSSDLSLIQSDEAQIELSFFYQDTDSNDFGMVRVEFLSSSSQVLGSGSTGGLGNTGSNGADYDSEDAPWTAVLLTEDVPSATTSVRITISTERSGGSATNVHFDSFSAEIGEQDPPLVSDYRSVEPWAGYDGSEPPATPAGSYFEIPFMPVTEAASAGALKIAGQGQAAAIFYDAADAKVVEIAAEALADDIERVTGIGASASSANPVGQNVILVGTIGKSPLIDSLVAEGAIDVSAIEGKWEAYTAKVVESPMSGVSKALVIAGSDRRGTAFGVFGLSESMGVSPWYWWGNIAVPQKATLYVAGSHTQQSPGVKYRGIFLNDEDWGLQPWAAETFEPEVGNIGPKTYGTIFELLLRMHANIIWPAMHEFPVETTPFYLVPGNKAAADNYAIVISTSHHEPILTNSHEYDEGEMGPYNYWTNRNNIYNFWEERVEETAGYENMYTIGMRGRTDAGMASPAGTTNAERAEKIQNEIIPDQRQMISDHVNGDASEIPQIFIPYKETLVQYQSGLELPDDVTILWPDDNHGYIRQLSNEEERARSGGSGVYYHLSYWGGPSSYLWFCSTPPGMTCSEMIKAWDFNAKKFWLVNVGDLKPHEIGTDFFLRMARDPEAFRDFDQTAYLTQWAARNFEDSQAAAIAEVLTEYYRLNIEKRPEHLNRSSSGFSMVTGGDEALERLDRFAALTAAAEGIYNQLPEGEKAGFYELVLFSIRASEDVNRRTLLAERSRLWEEQERGATNALAAEAQAAHDDLFDELEFYNEVNANGKWNLMFNPMNISQLPNWARETQNPFIMPSVGNYSPSGSSELGVAVEGESGTLNDGDEEELPLFSRPSDNRSFIDVFNQGSGSFLWSATASEPWIQLSQTNGNGDARIEVSIDWDTAPRGHAVPGKIRINGGGSQVEVAVYHFYPLELDLDSLPDAVEENGVVEIEAENYFSRAEGQGAVNWTLADQATASDDGMTVQPITAASVEPAQVAAESPSLTYRFHTFGKGSVNIRTQCLSTHRITSDHAGLRYAISLNGDEPRIVDVNAPEYSSAWNANTLRAASYGESQHEIAEPGLQTLRVWMVDAGVVLDKFTIDITTGLYEAESLQVEETNTSVVIFDDPPASGAEGLHIQSTAANHYATVALPNVEAGDYELIVRVKKWGSRGIVQMSVKESLAGSFENVGGEYDLYSSSSSYEDLESLPVSFSSSGTKYLRFLVKGKNTAASNYWILLDYVKLKPVRNVSGAPLENWRQRYFGTSENEGSAANLADPDGDGISNLLEYATGSYPTSWEQSVVGLELDGGRLSLSFNRAKEASDLVYRVFAGDDLPPEELIWSSLGKPYEGGNDPVSLVLVPDVELIGDNPRRFMVLNVEGL